MSSHDPGLIVLSPLGRPDAGAWRFAARPSSLAGRRLGLVDNGKYNSDRFLEAVASLLAERHGTRAAGAWRKPSPARGVSPEHLAEMKEAGVEAVVAGVGD